MNLPQNKFVPNFSTTKKIFTAEENPCSSNPCLEDFLCIITSQGLHECICVTQKCLAKNTNIFTTKSAATASTTSTTSTTTTTTTTKAPTTTTAINNPCESNPCSEDHMCISGRYGRKFQCICITSNCLKTTTRNIPKAFFCRDVDESACVFAAANNLCSDNNYINTIVVTKYCRKSCQRCD